MSVIKRILDLMELDHISARKLTQELGLANSCISEWKKEKAKPSIDSIIKIATYFGVTTDYLLLDEEAQENSDTQNQNGIADSVNVIDVTEQSANAAPVRNYRSHLYSREGTRHTTEVSSDELRLLECYKKLDEEDKEYIRCKLVVMNRESMDS